MFPFALSLSKGERKIPTCWMLSRWMLVSLHIPTAGALDMPQDPVSVVEPATGPASYSWVETDVPEGHLAFTFTTSLPDPGCATYNGKNCLWGKPLRDIDLAKVKPLFCGTQHKALYGETGYERPNHWCSVIMSKGPSPTKKIGVVDESRMEGYSIEMEVSGSETVNNFVRRVKLLFGLGENEKRYCYSEHGMAVDALYDDDQTFSELGVIKRKKPYWVICYKEMMNEVF